MDFSIKWKHLISQSNPDFSGVRVSKESIYFEYQKISLIPEVRGNQQWIIGALEASRT